MDKHKSDSVTKEKILLIGNIDLVHVGAHLNKAAKRLGLDVRFCDTSKGYESSLWVMKLNWWMRDHRPPRLREFSDLVVQACRDFEPTGIVSTGMAPIDADGLSLIKELGVRRLNYLTDDPWNPAHRSCWFMKALPLYDHVFSPRRANLEDLRCLGCKEVSYLPFAYSPDLHFPEPPANRTEYERFTSEVVFAGGADPDRIPYMTSLIQAGFKLVLYGGYWERYRATKHYSRSYADPSTLRKAIGGARVALCLVRHANRDGHSMRSFEVPAMGACMLVEDTREHREIFGEDQESVVYFSDTSEMVEKTKWLLSRDEERDRLRAAALERIVGGRHTYEHRLQAMLSMADGSS